VAFNNGEIFYTIIYLKAIAAILCFGLCAYEIHLSPTQQKKYMPIYWYVTLLYCFPFLSFYTAFIYQFSMAWVINLLFTLILLHIFSSWRATIFLSVIGAIIAFLLFASTDYSFVTGYEEHHKMLGYIYCFLTVAIVLGLKHRDALQEKELEAKVLYGAAIAHEMVNPLQGAAMMSDIFIEAFKNKTHPDQISLDDFNDIKELLEPFQRNTKLALKTIDRMLTLVRTDISEADDIGDYNITDCVEDTLKSYGLSEQRLARVNVNKKNSFKFKGSKHFVGHVIANLISNALKYAGPQSSIEIWYENNELHFKDNGYGIAPEKLPYIFEPFDKKGSTRGTGVGLPFCKRVMESMGGSIECTSELGKGAEFVLKFGDN
jgi:signal transduction histidine kinase